MLIVDHFYKDNKMKTGVMGPESSPGLVRVEVVILTFTNTVKEAAKKVLFLVNCPLRGILRFSAKEKELFFQMSFSNL